MSEKKRSIGGLWKRSGQYGDWYSGSVEINGQKHNFVAYGNRYKEQGDKKPDFQIYPSEPRKAESHEASKEENIGF